MESEAVRKSRLEMKAVDGGSGEGGVKLRRDLPLGKTNEWGVESDDWDFLMEINAGKVIRKFFH